MAVDYTIDEQLYRSLSDRIDKPRCLALLCTLSHNTSPWFTNLTQVAQISSVQPLSEIEVCEAFHHLAETSKSDAPALYLLCVRAIRYGKRPAFCRIGHKLKESLKALSIDDSKCTAVLALASFPRLNQVLQAYPDHADDFHCLASHFAHPKHHAKLAIVLGRPVAQPKTPTLVEEVLHKLKRKFAVALPLLSDKYVYTKETQTLHDAVVQVSYPQHGSLDLLRAHLNPGSSLDVKLADILTLNTEYQNKKTAELRIQLLERCLRFGSPGWAHGVINAAEAREYARFVDELSKVCCLSRDRAAAGFVFATTYFEHLEATKVVATAEFRKVMRPLLGVIAFGSRHLALTKQLHVKVTEKEVTEFRDLLATLGVWLKALAPQGFTMPARDTMDVDTYVTKCIKSAPFVQNYAIQCLLILELDKLKQFNAQPQEQALPVQFYLTQQLRVRPSFTERGILPYDFLQRSVRPSAAEAALSQPAKPSLPEEPEEPKTLRKQLSDLFFRDKSTPAVQAKPKPKQSVAPAVPSGDSDIFGPEHVVVAPSDIDSAVEWEAVLAASREGCAEAFLQITEDFADLPRAFMLGPMGQHLRSIPLVELRSIDTSMTEAVLRVYADTFGFDDDCLYIWFGTTNAIYMAEDRIPDIKDVDACIDEARKRLVRVDPKDKEMVEQVVHQNKFTPIAGITGEEEDDLSFSRDDLEFYSAYRTNSDGTLIMLNISNRFMPQRPSTQ